MKHHHFYSYYFAVIIIINLLWGSVKAADCGPYQNSPSQLFFSTQTLFSYPSSIYAPSSFSYQGLVWSFNSTGFVEVKETTGNLVFAFGYPTTCSTTNYCTATFQKDGNLVIGRIDGSVSWASNTWGGQGRFLKYQTTPPYVSVIGSECTAIWPGTTTGQPLVSKPSTTVLGAVNTAKVSYTSTSLPASRWKSQFAINVHISHGWSSSMVRVMANYLGISTLRDHLPSLSPGSSQYNDYVAMKNAGIRLNVVASGTSDISGLQSQVNAWATFQSATGMIQSIEGFNEINNFGFDYYGVNHDTSYVGMYQAQKDLYTLVKSNTVLKNLPVFDFTGQCYHPSSDQVDCNNISGRADRTNLHVYFSNGAQLIGLGGSNNYIQIEINEAYGRQWTSLGNNVITETGWHTDNFPNGVTENAAAKLQVNGLLGSIQAGNSKTFIYEMLDEVWAGYDGQESHFGLFRNNQAAKPSARALRFISTLLNDTGSALTQTLAYSLTGFPYAGQKLLFQKSNGLFVLALWNNIPVYNPITQTDITNTATQVTLSLPWSTTINVYDVFSTTASDSLPLSPIGTANSMNAYFGLSDKAVFITFTAPPTPAPTPKPTTCPAQFEITQNNQVTSTATQPVLRSTNCVYTLSISSVDGSFQIKNGNTVTYQSTIWSQQAGPFRLIMQADGNLVVYSSSNGAIWSSGTGYGYGYPAPGPFAAQLGTDGKLKVVDTAASAVLWSSS